MKQNQNSQKPTGKAFSLTDTIVDVEPVGVVYNITNTLIENFVKNYLTETKHIDGILAVRVILQKHPKFGFITKIYVAISKDSDDITSKSIACSSLLGDKLGTGVFRTTPKLQGALSRLTKDTRLFTVGRGTSEKIAVELDPRKVFSLMLAVDPHRHGIRLTESKPLKKNASIMSVTKYAKFADDSNDDSDEYVKLFTHRR